MSYFNGPQIVTNGLVCVYNAAVPKCYNGVGSTVRDLTNRGNNITNMTPQFYSAQSGLFVFTGVLTPTLTSFNQSAVLPTAYTIQITLQAPQNISGVSNAMGVFGRTTYPISGFALGMGQTINNYTFFGYTPSGNHPSSILGPISYSKPDILTFTYNNYTGIGYLNGEVKYTITGGYAPVNLSMFIGGHNQGGWSNMSGYIYSFYVYNRALTYAEVLNNYNVTRSKYGR